mmetsp:Transcript_36844/g.60645  ORF Transcript_36844/g.60645 Transcript_36844/m.60645 type:complete len:88 (-) Transcript_36844:373-636(-)
MSPGAWFLCLLCENKIQKLKFILGIKIPPQYEFFPRVPSGVLVWVEQQQSPRTLDKSHSPWTSQPGLPSPDWLAPIPLTTQNTKCFP